MYSQSSRIRRDFEDLLSGDAGVSGVMRYTSLAIFPQYNKEFERYIYGLDALIAQLLIT
jgi:hypothetical protein